MTGVARVMTELTPRLQRRLAEDRIPGLAVGIVSPQGLAWSAGYGVVDLATGLAPHARTLFRVASITKTFTAALILLLRDEGKVSLDEPLARYLPEFAKARARVGSVEQVTLRRLLAHHSGLVTESPLPGWDTQEFPSLREVLDALPDTEIVTPPDHAFKYSNLAYGLLGEVIRRVSGKPYSKILQERLLQPLGMLDSGIDVSDSMKTQLAVGYHSHLFDGGYDVAPVAPLNGIAACGQLYSSVADLARWLAFQLSADHPHQMEFANLPLSRATLAESHRPQYLEADWSVGYCLGWRANRFGSRVYHGHGGALFGYASYVLFCKSQGVGVVCLANLWPHPGLLPLAVEIADAVIDSGELANASPRLDALAPRPADYAALLGIYEARPGIFATIAFRDGELRLEKSPLSDYLLHAPAVLQPLASLSPSSDSPLADSVASKDSPQEPDSISSFVVRGGRAAGERVVFEREATGQVVSFTIGGFVYRRLQKV
ncbi:MAG: serine hydrolase domain-containing protein [Pirellulales bacterium]